LVGSTVSGYDSPYKNFMDDTANYAALTTHNTCSFSSSSFPCSGIDHIILLKTATPQLIPNSVQVFLELKTAVSNYLNTTSDHVPVYGLFLRPTDTNTEIPHENVASVYPNPFQETLNIQDFEGRFELLNLLGQTLYSGEGNSTLQTQQLASGIYILRLISEKGVMVKSVVRM
jgi:Secretion system C-terminal sorting domain